jgi:methionine sulfoxide reductase heme-binding subunit
MKKRILKTVSRNPLWLCVNTVSLLLLIWLVWMVMAVPDLPGPVMFAEGVHQNIILFSGQSALVLLVLSLACTPAARILGFTQAIKVRKSLGLWGFFYACFHALSFMGGKDLFLLDSQAWRNVGQMLPSILSGLTKTPYARYGAYALLLLLPLALTSNRLSIRILRNNWKRLHRLIYLAVPLAIYHYWQREDFTVFTGEVPEYWKPAVFAVVVGLLLLMRVPPVRRWLAARLSLQRLNKLRKITQSHSVPVDVVETGIEVWQPAPNGALAVILWLVHILFLGKHQRSKLLIRDAERLESAPGPDDKLPPGLR